MGRDSGVAVSLCAPYPFKQPPDPESVAARIDEHRRGIHPSLGALVLAFRRIVASRRRLLMPPANEADSVMVLRSIAAASDRLSEYEAALRQVYEGAYATRLVRCGRCHRQAPANARDVLLHDSGSMLCSGSGDRARPG
jgi:phytoene dehydrogenase-like protein